MPACRHDHCDSTNRNLTCGNECRDSIGSGHECRHDQLQAPSEEARQRRLRDAVTGPDVRESPQVEISSEEGEITLRFPTERPMLTRRAAHVLLGILVGLTEVPVLDRPEGGESDGS
jgi:hypothetical protein